MIDFITSLFNSGAQAQSFAAPQGASLQVGQGQPMAAPTMAPQASKMSPQAQGILQALAAGGVNALGGGRQREQQQLNPMPFRGDPGFDNPGARKFSGARMGLLNLGGM